MVQDTLNEAQSFFVNTPQNIIVEEVKDIYYINSPDILESIKDLAYWAYIYNNGALSLKIGSLISDIPFAGNFDIWTWVQYVLVLQARIYHEEDDHEKAKQCIDTINGLLSYGDESKINIRKKTFARRLNGSLLFDDKIKEAMEANDVEKEKARRFLQFNELCFMKEMGGSETYPPTRIEQMIQENLDILRKSV